MYPFGLNASVEWNIPKWKARGSEQEEAVSSVRLCSEDSEKELFLRSGIGDREWRKAFWERWILVVAAGWGWVGWETLTAGTQKDATEAE